MRSVVIAALVSVAFVPASTLKEQVQLHGGFTKRVYACTYVCVGHVENCMYLHMCLSCAEMWEV